MERHFVVMVDATERAREGADFWTIGRRKTSVVIGRRLRRAWRAVGVRDRRTRMMGAVVGDGLLLVVVDLRSWMWEERFEASVEISAPEFGTEFGREEEDEREEGCGDDG